MRVVVVGAGLSGSVLASTLANTGIEVDVLDSRSHVGGNCYTSVDPETRVIEHIYGPHIFHTDDPEVWEFVSSRLPMKPFNHQVIAQTSNGIFPLPVNLLTINQVFGRLFSPSEAREFIQEQTKGNVSEARNLEETALASIGPTLYKLFFEGYTQKQWGRPPSEIPSSVFSRLPIRFDYRSSYFDHPFQAMPENGYTPLFESLLDHPLINLYLDTEVTREVSSSYDHVFWSGPLDSYFNRTLGGLPYRTLDFHRETQLGDYQGTSVINYTDASVPFTRVTEHRHFAPWRDVKGTVVYREYSRECSEEDVPYYPVRTSTEDKLLEGYLKLALKEQNVSFVGRLGTFRYLDMDKCIREALNAGRKTLSCLGRGDPIPTFFI